MKSDRDIAVDMGIIIMQIFPQDLWHTTEAFSVRQDQDKAQNRCYTTSKTYLAVREYTDPGSQDSTQQTHSQSHSVEDVAYLDFPPEAILSLMHMLCNLLWFLELQKSDFRCQELLSQRCQVITESEIFADYASKRHTHDLKRHNGSQETKCNWSVGCRTQCSTLIAIFAVEFICTFYYINWIWSNLDLGNLGFLRKRYCRNLEC